MVRPAVRRRPLLVGVVSADMEEGPGVKAVGSRGFCATQGTTCYLVAVRDDGEIRTYRVPKITSAKSGSWREALLASECIAVALMVILMVVIVVRVAVGFRPFGHVAVSHMFVPQHGVGLSTIALASVSAFMAFLGLREPARSARRPEIPGRTVPRAILLAVVGSGILFLLCAVVAGARRYFDRHAWSNATLSDSSCRWRRPLAGPVRLIQTVAGVGTGEHSPAGDHGRRERRVHQLHRPAGGPGRSPGAAPTTGSSLACTTGPSPGWSVDSR